MFMHIRNINACFPFGLKRVKYIQDKVLAIINIVGHKCHNKFEIEVIY